MKILLVLLVSLAAASAGVLNFSPTLYSAAIPITTQYHAQDGLGQYSYGYSGGPSAKAEYKSLDGVTRGSYSYVDADGELQTVEYVADSANGFQASATNLPKAPIDDKTAPKPVEDTPEVAMAKAEHFAAYREAEIKAAEQPDNGGDIANQEDHSLDRSSQERQGEVTSAETENPNGVDTSSERSTERMDTNGSDNGNGNGNGNGNANGKTIENDTNGGNGITRLSNNGLNGISSLNSGLNLDSLNGGLSSLQLNDELTRGLDINSALQLSDFTPATTSQLHPISLANVPVPGASYLRVSTPTHGYSIVSPTVLAALPTLQATSSQTISRTLPISLSSEFLTQ